MATNWNAVLANINNASDILAILRKVLGLLDGKVDLTRIDEIIQDITNMETDVKSALENVNAALTDFDSESQEAIQQVIAAGLMEGFTTEAELLVSRPTVLKKYAKAEDTDVIWFWNKPEGSPEGSYWNSTGLSDYSKSIKFTTEKTNEIINAFDIKKAVDPDIISIRNDALGRSLLYYDKKKERIVGAGLLESVFELIEQLKTYEDSRYIPGKLDKNGRMLWGWDKLTDRFFCGENFSSQQNKKYRYFTQKPVPAEINHMLSYGESLSVGATAVTILSTTQPYSNKTFSKGPRLDPLGSGEVLSVIDLVEQYNNPSSDGRNDRGETHCSGAANYASLMLLKAGISPENHVIFASTAGQGGAKIAELAYGGAVFSRLLNHVNKAKELNPNRTYKVPMMPFSIGVNDAAAGTTYEDFKGTLTQVCTNINSNVKALSGQSEDIIFAFTQPCCGVKISPQISKAIWDLTSEKNNYVFVTPVYFFPHDGDETHLTNVGYKWMGAYWGRVYTQYINEGRYPDYIKPLSAYIEGNKVIIKFDVPTWPLQIDTSTLAETTNAGFKVMDGISEMLIMPNGVNAVDDTVIIQLASTPTANVKVRYALDYLGAGLKIKNGASGNLRDSTTDSILIAGTKRSLYHVCPHFELTAYLDKGI
jgi:hypothetical protein